MNSYTIKKNNGVFNYKIGKYLDKSIEILLKKKNIIIHFKIFWRWSFFWNWVNVEEIFYYPIEGISNRNFMNNKLEGNR